MAINSVSRDKFITFAAKATCQTIGSALKVVGASIIPLAVAHFCKAAAFFTQQRPVFSASVAGTDVTEWSESKESAYAWCAGVAVVGCVAAKALSKAGDYLIAKAPVKAVPFDASKEA